MDFEPRRFKFTDQSREKLLEEASNLREEAKLLPYGPLREAVLKKARHAEAAAHLDDWVNSPGLQPPKGEIAGPN